MILFAAVNKLTNFFVFAAPGDTCALDKSNVFFFIPPWWNYLDGHYDFLNQCVPAFTFPGDIWVVGLAILDMLLRIAGFIAVVAIVIAGIRYMGSGGNPEKAASARRGIYNALIGLFIALTATAVVTFIGNRLTG